jgi:TonB family protein
MNSRLGIVLAAFFLIFASASIAPAQAAQPGFGASTACMPSPSLRHPPRSPLTHTKAQAWFPGEGNVQGQFTFKRAEVIHRVMPEYPPEAEAKGIQGKVVLDAVICKDGHVKILRTISGQPILARPAIEAVSQWIYDPARRNGEPIEVETEITVIFSLPDKPGEQIASAPQRPLRPPTIRVDGKIQSKKIVYRLAPIYPPRAKQRHAEGTVMLRALIDKDGDVQALRFVSGPPLLVQAAMDAVRRWKYKPTLRNGEPVTVETTIEVAFKLPRDAKAKEGHK